MGRSRGRIATLTVYNVGSVTIEHSSLFQYTTAAWSTCNSSRMYVFDAVRGGGYGLSFWRVVQSIVAKGLQLVHV